ncbi:MAG: phytoene desaturase family protein [Campylobacterota bacterium]
MKKYKTAVVGSGIGGSLIAALNCDDLILFEKDKNLGGCASTFKRYGSYFNAGATTFVGYEKNHPIKKIFDKIEFYPNIKKSKTAIRVVQNDKVLDRTKDFDKFLEDINSIYPNKNNEKFWKKIKTIDEKFWQLKKLHFAKYGLNSYAKSFIFVCELLKVFKFDIFKTARSYIEDILGEISYEYQSFIDAQLFITVQTTSKNIPLLTMALGLAYPFHDVFYANNGMGSLFDGVLKDVNVHKKEEVKLITKDKSFYKVQTTKETYLVENVVLNSTVYNSAELFENQEIKNYYSSFEFSDQSAFVVYMKLDCKLDLIHHYQIILNRVIPNCISNSFFVSFSDIDDEKMSKNGLSVTISTHTKAMFWEKLTKQEYELHKKESLDFIVDEFLKNFDMIKKDSIKSCFGGTSKTFNSYINRFNCGGLAISFKSALKMASCKTPFKGLYNVGDTVFAGQGWPGVAIGVEVLNKELNEKF